MSAVCPGCMGPCGLSHAEGCNDPAAPLLPVSKSPLNNSTMCYTTEDVDYQVEYFSEKFEKYAAATKMAELASKGSGELNQFDHVAKDLHEAGFDETLELVENWRLNAFMAEHEQAINALASERYSE